MILDSAISLTYIQSLFELHLSFGLDIGMRGQFFIPPRLELLNLGVGCFLNMGLAAVYVQRLGEFSYRRGVGN